MEDSKTKLERSLTAVGRMLTPDAVVTLERPRDPSHGDYATNFALTGAKALKRKPRDVADDFKRAAEADAAVRALVDAIEIAGPGFINLRLKPDARRAVVPGILALRGRFGRSSARAGERIMVEFVSANPTGPLHVGHGRQAALGDAIASLLQSQGA
ncbi:MAG TPA: hypothetical protein VII68_02005, partial [Casimicrobiaceae bacterium]